MDEGGSRLKVEGSKGTGYRFQVKRCRLKIRIRKGVRKR
jgi:hypothetical protein